jgi:hypothetical protein
MSVPLAVEIKRKFEASFAPSRPFMITFFRRMIDEMVSPLDNIAVLDPQRKRKKARRVKRTTG